MHLIQRYCFNRHGFSLLAAASLLAGCAHVEFSAKADIPVIAVKPASEAPQAEPKPEEKTEARNAEPDEAVLRALSIDDAIRTGLRNNQSLRVEQITPAELATFVAEQRAIFDPVLSANASRTYDRMTRDLRVPNVIAAGTPGDPTAPTITGLLPVELRQDTRTDAGTAGITQRLPIGTDISASAGPSRTVLDNDTSNRSLAYAPDTASNGSSVALSITQPLLRGAWLKVNLAPLREARLNQRIAGYQLRTFVEGLVAQIETAYWDLSLAEKQIAIFEESLKIAASQADEVNERIRIGKLAETDRAAAAAEVARRNSQLIDARSARNNALLLLLRLVNPDEGPLGAPALTLKTEMTLPQDVLNSVADSIALARRMRPEMNQARLQIAHDDLEVVRTRNGLLPQLNLFATWGKNLARTSYSALLTAATQQDVRDSQYSTEIGAQFSYPIGNRAARAQHDRSKLQRTASGHALANLAQLVEQDVRSAYIEVSRANEQIAATAATRTLQEETLNSEREKYRLGKSTILLVTQAQRDLLQAQINEVQAKTAYVKAVVSLYHVEGSLLERRGVMCPGGESTAPDEPRPEKG